MKNRFGLDQDYFEENLSILLRDISCYRPDEMARALVRLAIVADGVTAIEDMQKLIDDAKKESSS